MTGDPGAVPTVTTVIEQPPPVVPALPEAPPVVRIVRVAFTAKDQGYFGVMLDGALKSRHSQEREAMESATRLAIANPNATVAYYHDYEVKVTVET